MDHKMYLCHVSKNERGGENKQKIDIFDIFDMTSFVRGVLVSVLFIIIFIVWPQIARMK